ncbi:TPA: lipoprotein, partial [Klebsiella pneumoniae]|nr:lipoprotein [Klebsiella pneumoniae]
MRKILLVAGLTVLVSG